MMQVAIHEIIHMFAVRHGFVPATFAMNVIDRVSGTIVRGCANFRIGRTYGECMLFNRTILLMMMQVAIMQVVDMIAVLNSRVPAIWAVSMIVVLVRVVHHIPSE